MTKANIRPLEPPPVPGIQITDESWKRWLYLVYGAVGEGGQGTFPRLRVANATFTDENAFQDLVNLNKGLYVRYSSTVDSIIYGFACNVKRASGHAHTVGAQINSYAERGAQAGGLFGIATEAIAAPYSNVYIVGLESSCASLTDATQLPKFGINAVFKDRGDGAGAAPNGLGANRYNYWSRGLVFSSQSRSSAAEFCGWNTGIEFGDYWGDEELVPAWSAVVTYLQGQCVSSGGVVYKAITPSLNQSPAASPTFWVQRTVGTTANLCVGIDFSSMSTGAMARMASAIRLRATQKFHWEETGQIGTYFSAATALFHVADNAGTSLINVNVTNGNTTILGTLAANLVAQAWTPVLTAATPGDLAVTYLIQRADAVKLGQWAFASFDIVTNAFTHATAAGAARITGLPYTPATVTNATWAGSLAFQGITKAGYTQFAPRLDSGSATINFIASGSAVAGSFVAITEMPTGGTVALRGSVIYRI